jgi:hypothetical protein
MNFLPYRKITIRVNLSLAGVQQRLLDVAPSRQNLWQKLGYNWSQQSFSGRYHGRKFKIKYAEDGFNRIVCCGKITAIGAVSEISLLFRYNYFGVSVMGALFLIFFDLCITDYTTHQFSYFVFLPLLLYMGLWLYFNYFFHRMRVRIETLLQSEDGKQ